jgi:predicted Rossmann fold nucleotide-binding protein DprA/Smf involved in DNA uptake
MPPVPDVSAIVESVKSRIKQIEGELAKHERLSEELERLRDALGRLEGAARSRVSARREAARPAARSAGRAKAAGGTRSRAAGGGGAARPAGRSSARGKRAGAGPGTGAPARAPRGQNKAKVLEALKDGPMTASEIANATGIATGTVSTLLTKLSKSGEVVKAERGYRLPERPE